MLIVMPLISIYVMIAYAHGYILFQVFVCASSNVAVDQLAEKISATGLKVRIVIDVNDVEFFNSTNLFFY